MAEEEQVVEEVEEEEEEEEPVDYQEVLKEKCAETSACAKLKELMDECTERVEGKEQTTETCTEELIDFIHCVDHCVAKTLFKKLV